MSLLFRYFYDGDVDKFRSLLALPGYNPQTASRNSNISGGGGSPVALEATSRSLTKPRKVSGWGTGFGTGRHGNGNLGRAEVNARDHVGLTVLLRAASSTAENAIEFVQALLDHPAIDIYVQDPESGWNCLHRALYAGNISIARLILEKERKIFMDLTLGASVSKVGQLIKTKDHEGNAPFDLFNSTIGERDPTVIDERAASDEESESEEATILQGSSASVSSSPCPVSAPITRCCRYLTS